MRRWLPWLLAAIVLLGLLLWSVLLRRETLAVQVVEASRGRVESTVTNTKAGTIRARKRAKLSPEIGGKVVALPHAEGDWVEAGEPLVALEASIQEARLALSRQGVHSSEASLNEACIQRDRARRELVRKRELAAENVISEDLLDQLESAYAAARASCNRFSADVERARAEVAAREIEVEKMLIRAPFAGMIAEITVEVGEWITPSPPLLKAPAVLDLIDPRSLYVSAPMDEVDSAAIRNGQTAKVTVDSHPGVEFEGRVVRVAPFVLDIEAQNRTVEIEVEIENPPGDERRLLPGTSSDVEVVLERREAVLRIPASALLEGDRVLLAENGRLSEQVIEVGLRNWNWVEVRDGLADGAHVVTTLDRSGIEEGARVEAERVEYTP